MLEVRSLRAGYGGTEVLRGLDLSVGAGEIVAVLGSNGVGKTTLNKVLSGVLRANDGEILFDGKTLTGTSSADIVKAGLIHVPEGRKIFPNMSVRENLELGSYRRGRDRRSVNLERVFDTFPRLRERSGQAAGTLSGGEQQMLAIARALMLGPRLMLLDEPSFGLAPLIVVEIFRILRRINEEEKVSILLVEQNAALALDLADHAYVLETGHVVMSGPSAVVKNDENIRKSYLGY
jgi:branched-chain amino acid transport system ATP-binding protein